MFYSKEELIAHLDERGIKHYYCKDGNWYNLIKTFPVVLICDTGFINFKTKSQLIKCPYTHIGESIHANKNGAETIADIPGFVEFLK